MPPTTRLRGSWAMFQNSGVLLQMIQYAERTGCSTNSNSLAELRNDAMRIRIGALNRMLLHAHLERLH